MLNYLTIKKFADLSGYSETAIRAKIKKKIWQEGDVWIRAPDGHPLINVINFESWVENAQGLKKDQKRPSKSVSSTRGIDAGNGSNSSPHPLI